MKGIELTTIHIRDIIATSYPIPETHIELI